MDTSRSLASIVTLVALAAAPACYRTVVATNAPAAGPVHSDRQWFTVGGLVELSDEAGGECGSAGVARADSRLAFVDILIDFGLVVAGTGTGLALCDDSDAEAYASCVSLMAAVPPFLIGSRTVTYRCRAEGTSAPLGLVPASSDRR